MYVAIIVSILQEAMTMLTYSRTLEFLSGELKLYICKEDITIGVLSRFMKETQHGNMFKLHPSPL
jgi:hypothetical protein